MKRLLVLSFKTVVLILVLALLLCLVADVVWEAHGIPDWATNTIQAAFAERGISLQADNIRAGLARGIVLEQARLRLDCQGLPVLVSADEMRARPLLRHVLLGRVDVQEAMFRGVTVAVFVGPAAAPAEERPALRLERCTGLAHRRRDGVVTLTMSGLAEKIAVHLEAELRHLDAASLAGAPAPRRPAPPPAAGAATQTQIGRAHV